MLLLLVAAGSVGIWSTRLQAITPGVAALGAAAIAVGIAVAKLFAAVGTELSSMWGKRAADKVDLVLSRRGRRYEAAFLRNVRTATADIDVRGLTTVGDHALDLADIFIELTILARPPQDISSDPVGQVPVAERGDRTILDFVAAGVAGRPAVFAIIGAPGSGKTTLLRHLAATIANRSSRLPQPLRRSVPLFLPFRDVAGAIVADPSIPLSTLVRQHWLIDMVEPADWLESRLRDGSCVVMFDGLDEVPTFESRRVVVDWVNKQVSAHSENLFLLTSRPYGYSKLPVTGASVLQVLPFSNDQKNQFIRHWYAATERRRHGGAHDVASVAATTGANDLIARLQNNQPLFDLAVNPLLLTMIAFVHLFRASLPGARAALYAEICDVFLGRRQEAKGLSSELTATQKIAVLQTVAWQMMERRTLDLPVKDIVPVVRSRLEAVAPSVDARAFIDDIEKSSGLLVEREADVFAFAHLTFQEFLAALQIEELQENFSLASAVRDEWWYETLRLLAARSDASAIILAAVASAQGAALSLAIDCIDEAREVSEAVRSSLEDALARRLNAYYGPGGSRSDDAIRMYLRFVVLNRFAPLGQATAWWGPVPQCVVTMMRASRAEDSPLATALRDLRPLGGIDPLSPAVGLVYEDVDDVTSFVNAMFPSSSSAYRLPTQAELADSRLCELGPAWIEERDGTASVSGASGSRHDPLRMLADDAVTLDGFLATIASGSSSGRGPVADPDAAHKLSENIREMAGSSVADWFRRARESMIVSLATDTRQPPSVSFSLRRLREDVDELKAVVLERTMGDPVAPSTVEREQWQEARAVDFACRTLIEIGMWEALMGKSAGARRVGRAALRFGAARLVLEWAAVSGTALSASIASDGLPGRGAVHRWQELTAERLPGLQEIACRVTDQMAMWENRLMGRHSNEVCLLVRETFV